MENDEILESVPHENPSRVVGAAQINGILENFGVVNRSPEVVRTPLADVKLIGEDGKVNRAELHQSLVDIITSLAPILQNTASVDLEAKDAMSGIASIYTTAKQILAELEKPLADDKKHQQKLELEAFKSKLRMDETLLKHELALKAAEAKKGPLGGPETASEDGELVLFDSQSVIEAVVAGLKQPIE